MKRIVLLLLLALSIVAVCDTAEATGRRGRRDQDRLELRFRFDRRLSLRELRRLEDRLRLEQALRDARRREAIRLQLRFGY